MNPKPLLASILMKQQTPTAFENGKTTRRAQFLAEMEQVVPWTQLCALIEPVYPKGGSGEGGRLSGHACECWNRRTTSKLELLVEFGI